MSGEIDKYTFRRAVNIGLRKSHILVNRFNNKYKDYVKIDESTFETRRNLCVNFRRTMLNISIPFIENGMNQVRILCLVYGSRLFWKISICRRSIQTSDELYICGHDAEQLADLFYSYFNKEQQKCER